MAQTFQHKAQEEIIDYIPARVFRSNKVKVMHRRTYTSPDTTKFFSYSKYFIDTLGRYTKVARIFSGTMVRDTLEIKYDTNGNIICKKYFAEQANPYLQNDFKYNSKGKLVEMKTGPHAKTTYKYSVHGDSLYRYTVRNGITDKIPDRIEIFNKDHIVKVQYNLWYNKPTRYLTMKNTFDKNGILTELVCFNYDGRLIERLKPVYNDKRLIIEDSDLLPTAISKNWVHKYSYEYYE